MLRRLPNGATQEFRVVDPNIVARVADIGPSYQVKVELGDVPEVPAQTFTQNITNNVSGPNARINIDSVDASSNAIDASTTQVFDHLKSIAQANIKNREELAAILAKIHEMQQTQNTAGFASAYRSFIEGVAAHMTVFAPVIPALSALLR